MHHLLHLFSHLIKKVKASAKEQIVFRSPRECTSASKVIIAAHLAPLQRQLHQPERPACCGHAGLHVQRLKKFAANDCWAPRCHPGNGNQNNVFEFLVSSQNKGGTWQQLAFTLFQTLGHFTNKSSRVEFLVPVCRCNTACNVCRFQGTHCKIPRLGVGRRRGRSITMPELLLVLRVS